MKQSEWVRIVGLWAGLWPHRPLPPESVEPWYHLLADLDADEVRTSLLSWANDPARSWPPQSPGELRAAQGGADPWPEALASLATAVRRHGSVWGQPDSLDPRLVGYVQSMGGWANLCRGFDPSDAATRAQFRDYWQTVTGREARDAAAALARAALPALNQGPSDGTRNPRPLG